MKKTRLGKVTFVLAGICLALFMAVKILDVWSLGRTLGGLKNMTKFIATASEQGKGMSVLIFLSKSFVIPIVWTLVGSLYVLAIKKCNPIKQSVCVASALAVLAELILLVAGGNGYFGQLSTRVCFIIVFVLLFLELKKSGFRKWIYITFGFTYMLTLGYVVLHMINVIQVFDIDIAFYAILTYLLLPVVFLSVAILVMGYILFPEKYIEV